MYTLTCPECKQEHPRASYRKRGGGVHKICPDCRKRVYNTRARLRQRVMKNRETLEQRAQAVYIKRRTEALTQEYNRVTNQNRQRIRLLSLNQKPTKATIKGLEWRTKEQERWRSALQQMLTLISSGTHLDMCLREYVEDQCTDV